MPTEKCVKHASMAALSLPIQYMILLTFGKKVKIYGTHISKTASLKKIMLVLCYGAASDSCMSPFLLPFHFETCLAPHLYYISYPISILKRER